MATKFHLSYQELNPTSLLAAQQTVVAVVQKAEEKIAELEGKIMLLEKLAFTDQLTKLMNRIPIVDFLDREMEATVSHELRAPQDGVWSLGVLEIDLRGFKLINDTLGHPQGDQVLAMVAQLISRSVRHVDLVARYGGDEFAVLLPETGRKAALRLGERILKEIHRHPYLHGPRIFPLSASIGIGSYHPSLSGAGALLREADQSLYAAKRGGRGRVVSGPLNSTDVFADVSATHLTSEICQS